MDTVHLVGAEDIRAAAHRMAQAAAEMQSAATTIDRALLEHRTYLAAWIADLQAIMQQAPHVERKP